MLVVVLNGGGRGDDDIILLPQRALSYLHRRLQGRSSVYTRPFIRAAAADRTHDHLALFPAPPRPADSPRPCPRPRAAAARTSPTPPTAAIDGALSIVCDVEARGTHDGDDAPHEVKRLLLLGRREPPHAAVLQMPRCVVLDDAAEELVGPEVVQLHEGQHVSLNVAEHPEARPHEGCADGQVVLAVRGEPPQGDLQEPLPHHDAGVLLHARTVGKEGECGAEELRMGRKSDNEALYRRVHPGLAHVDHVVVARAAEEAQQVQRAHEDVQDTKRHRPVLVACRGADEPQRSRDAPVEARHEAHTLFVPRRRAHDFAHRCGRNVAVSERLEDGNEEAIATFLGGGGAGRARRVQPDERVGATWREVAWGMV